MRVMKQCIVSMSPSRVRVQCEIRDDAGFHMRQQFQGCSLTSCKCENDKKVSQVQLLMTDHQWKYSMSEFEECLVIGARYDSGTNTADLCCASAAILPVSPCHSLDEGKPLRVGELFCGGFSGWTHAFHELIMRHMNIEHVFALDRDAMCCEVYKRTHQPDLLVWDPIGYNEGVESTQHGRPSVLFQTTIGDPWWLTCIGLYFPELICL